MHRSFLHFLLDLISSFGHFFPVVLCIIFTLQPSTFSFLSVSNSLKVSRTNWEFERKKNKKILVNALMFTLKACNLQFLENFNYVIQPTFGVHILCKYFHDILFKFEFFFPVSRKNISLLKIEFPENLSSTFSV